MGEAIRQFEPGRVQDWSHNSYPEMTEGLIKALDEQAREESEGRRFEEWEELRDRFLVRLVQLQDEAVAEFRHGGVKESGAAEAEA